MNPSAMKPTRPSTAAAMTTVRSVTTRVHVGAAARRVTVGRPAVGRGAVGRDVRGVVPRPRRRVSDKLVPSSRSRDRSAGPTVDSRSEATRSEPANRGVADRAKALEGRPPSRLSRTKRTDGRWSWPPSLVLSLSAMPPARAIIDSGAARYHGRHVSDDERIDAQSVGSGRRDAVRITVSLDIDSPLAWRGGAG